MKRNLGNVSSILVTMCIERMVFDDLRRKIPSELFIGHIKIFLTQVDYDRKFEENEFRARIMLHYVLLQDYCLLKKHRYFNRYSVTRAAVD